MDSERIRRIQQETRQQIMEAGREVHTIPKTRARVRTPEDSVISEYLDFTLLKPEADYRRFEDFCREAIELRPRAVCLPSNRVELAVHRLQGTGIQVCTVIGFPLGYSTSAMKAAETALAAECGTDELDMVIPIGLAKERGYNADAVLDLYHDVAAVVDSAGGRLVKVILETALLNDEEKIWAGTTALSAGAAMLKTSTGFAAAGATVEDVRLLRVIAGTAFGVKAAGGIRTAREARAMIAAGADRVGASAGQAIVCGEASDDAGSGKERY